MNKPESGQENPSNERLSTVEIDRNAFELIEGFKTSLVESKEFTDRLAHTYFGEIPHEFLGKPSVWRVDPELPRNVWFQVGDVSYEAQYTFSEDGQRFALSKNSLHRSEERVVTEGILLESRRFEEQEPKSSAQIMYYTGRGGDSELVPQYENTSLALEKAKEMLTGLSSQSPQK